MLRTQPPDAPGPPDSPELLEALESHHHHQDVGTDTLGNAGAAPLGPFTQSPQIALRGRPSAGRAVGVAWAEPACRAGQSASPGLSRHVGQGRRRHLG